MYDISKVKPQEVDDIASLFRDMSGRDLADSRARASIAKLPSAVARDDGRILGFAYCGQFAPDVLELRNCFVIPSMRSQGVGGEILQFLEASVPPPFRMMILVNSMLYGTRENKRPAVRFYERHGYKVISNTDNTWIMAKPLNTGGVKPG